MKTLKNYAPSKISHSIMPSPEASQLATTSVNKIIIVTNDVTLCLKRECSINSSQAEQALLRAARLASSGNGNNTTFTVENP